MTCAVLFSCFALAASCGGGKVDSSPQALAPVPEQAAPPVEQPSVQPPAAQPAPEPTPARLVYPKPGFTKVALHDEEVPLCLFSSYEDWQKPESFAKVKKQKLKADQRLFFGAYAPWCVNPGCDDRPMLQCTVTREGDAITVHAKYSGARKDGATCTENCHEVIASCNTEALPAGTYTVRYGAQTKEVRIPSVQKTPCFTLAAK